MRLLPSLAVLLAATTLAAARDEGAPSVVSRLVEEGNAFMEAGKHAEALKTYQDALALEPKATVPLFNGGLAAYLLKKHDVALDLWKRLKALKPEDGKLRAKLVQTYEALGKKKERDEEIAALYELRKETEDEELKEAEFFCRDQFEAGDRKVMVFHHYEWVGDRAIRYFFAVLDEDGQQLFRISLGSYQYMQDLAENMGTVEKGERYCHLDGYYPGGRHATFGFYAKEPTYDTVKTKVLEILKRDD